MITKFKIFENNNFQDEDDLVELFSQKYIEDYFEDNYDISIEDAIRSLNIWAYVDKDYIVSKLISNICSYTSIDNKEFDKYDYIDYIKDEMKVDIDFSELKNMSRDELIEIITDEGEERNFIKDYYEYKKYPNAHPEDIIMDEHGKNALDDIYPYIRNYIDKNEIIDIYRDTIDFETKQEFVKDSIITDKNLQLELLNLNPNTIDALFDIMDENKSIGKSYTFQKDYIKYHEKQDNLDDNRIANLLKDINDRYGLNPEIKKEYIDYLYVIDSEKYNL